MKNNYKLLIVLLLFAFLGSTAHAQFQEGDRFVSTQLTGLDITKWTFSMEGDSESSDFTQIGLNLSGGQFIQENLAVVATLGYLSVDPDDGDGLKAYSITGGVRYHVGGPFFGGAGLNYSKIDLNNSATTVNAFMIALEAGYSYFITERLAIEPGVNYALKLAGKIKTGGNDDIWLKTEPADGVDFDLTRMGLTVGITFFF